jgi:hypothetical protein
MPLPERYDSPRGLLNKLVRLGRYLEEEVTWDLFNDFALTAYHLCEWVKNDPSATPGIVSDAKALEATTELQACRDAANTIKHKLITRYKPKTKDTDVAEGYGVGRYGRGGYGVGEQQVTISMADGPVFDGLLLSREVVQLWQAFFERYPQLLRG